LVNIFGWTGTGPSYGAPVVLAYDAQGNPSVFGRGYEADVIGYDALGSPIYGKGYSMVNGQVVATPYVVVITEWHTRTVTVTGGPSAIELTDTTPPYTAAVFVPAVAPIFTLGNSTLTADTPSQPA
jgi:hypothetical protein